MSPITLQARATLVRDRRWLVTIVTVATAFVLAVYWPGYMTIDSSEQLIEARSGHFQDLQPPAMARVWSVVDAVWSGPAGMVLLNNLLFWTGAMLIVRRTLASTRARTLAAVLVVLYPPVLALLGTVWKDVALGASLMFALGLIVNGARTKAERIVRLFGVPLAILYACAVRHNGIAAAAPLVAAGVYAQWPMRSTRRLPLAAAAIGAAFLIAAGLNAVARNGPHQYATQLILLHDLVAMSIDAGTSLLPAHLRDDDRTFERVASHYTPEGAQRLFSMNPGSLPITEDPVEYAAIVTAWRTAVRGDEGGYLFHRWALFHAMLFGRADGSACFPFATGIRWDPTLRIPYAPTWANRVVMPVLRALANTLFFRPWIHALAALVLLVVAVHRGHVLAGAVVVSGLCYVVAYFFAGTTCDFRMTWWLVLSVPLAGLLLLTPLDPQPA